MDNGTIKVSDFLKAARATRDQANSVVKQAAADTEALTGIKDPADQGTATIPSAGDASNRSALGIPANGNNMGEANKEHNIMDVTKPNGVGEGSYETPRCGTSRDESIKSPTAPINKMAGIADIAARLKASAEVAQEKAAAPVQEKVAAPAVQLPTELHSDSDLMAKLASYAAVALASEEGRRAFSDILLKEAGVKEACALVQQAAAEVQAAAQEQVKAASSGLTYTDFQLAEMSKRASAAWNANFTTDFEKAAYAQGEADANAMADAVEAGQEPGIPGGGEEGLEDDQILAILQELVASGEVSQEEAEAILAAIGEGAADGIDPEELAAGLQQAVEAGELTPDQAAAIAQEVMGGGAEDVPAGAEEQAAAAAAADPTVAAAADQAVEKAASVLAYLWAPEAK